MLKVRVIPHLILQDGLLKKPIQFRNPRTVASPLSIVRVFEERQVDELVLVDRSASLGYEELDYELIYELAEELFVPFTFGGGIHSLSQIEKIVQAGAEKVIINTHAILNPDFITRAVSVFGSQCVVVSIDAKKVENSYEVYVRSGADSTGLDPVEVARVSEQKGAGEILINSIDNEGAMSGYDIELIRKVSKSVGIPVVAAGGCGKLSHFVDAVKLGGASAIAAGSIYHYTKYTPNMVKGALMDAGIPVRLYPNVDYAIT